MDAFPLWGDVCHLRPSDRPGAVPFLIACATSRLHARNVSSQLRSTSFETHKHFILCRVLLSNRYDFKNLLVVHKSLRCGLVNGKSLMSVAILVENTFRPYNGR